MPYKMNPRAQDRVCDNQHPIRAIALLQKMVQAECRSNLLIMLRRSPFSQIYQICKNIFQLHNYFPYFLFFLFINYFLAHQAGLVATTVAPAPQAKK